MMLCQFNWGVKNHAQGLKVSRLAMKQIDMRSFERIFKRLTNSIGCDRLGVSTFGRTCEHCELGELGFKVLDAGGYIPLRHVTHVTPLVTHVTHVTLSVTLDALSFERIKRGFVSAVFAD